MYTRFFVLLALAALQPALAGSVLIENVHLFDGKSGERSAQTMRVLVVDNVIQAVSAGPITPPDGEDPLRLDGGGRTLMPGLIDAHWHSALVGPGLMDALTADIGYLNLLAGKVAQATLMRGFTSVRDMGGPVFGLRRAIEEGLVAGPRIFPSGAMISQTGGHGDFRLPHEVPRAMGAPLSHSEQMGAAAIADGVDDVLRRAREQLMLGATQLKLMAGGGVSSVYDPLDVVQYSPEEIRAAVGAAENWGTYVTVHAYTSRAVRMAVEAGVKCVEHAQLIDEDTARLMAAQGVWWSLQPFLDDDRANPQQGAARLKQLMVSRGTERAYQLAKKHGIRVAFGTDILFSGGMGSNQTPSLTALTRWYEPGEILKMATGDNGELLALSGPRYPYVGPLGVIEEGALADLLLVDGDPSADLGLLERPETGLLLIMKNGQIHKNLLPPPGAAR
ncbi:hydrolase [Zobellella endophytica]|uniref:Hydrolase n=1 Tax=Zobellella endophytica TaxID=2116700 RepID=A0A2P7RBQ2_9GAMM|nr:amidohydrolase family protein [Zobellella endophytica]PSJ47668.1 hydrolase [Zobellella endophytica]